MRNKTLQWFQFESFNNKREIIGPNCHHEHICLKDSRISCCDTSKNPIVYDHTCL